ncbi:hypothetical protein JCM9533A_67370 [Catenuloplanes niger JCM 9533]
MVVDGRAAILATRPLPGRRAARRTDTTVPVPPGGAGPARSLWGQGTTRVAGVSPVMPPPSVNGVSGEEAISVPSGA